MATGHYLFYTEEDKLREIEEAGEGFAFPPARKTVTCFLISWELIPRWCQTSLEFFLMKKVKLC